MLARALGVLDHVAIELWCHIIPSNSASLFQTDSGSPLWGMVCFAAQMVRCAEINKSLTKRYLVPLLKEELFCF